MKGKRRRPPPNPRKAASPPPSPVISPALSPVPSPGRSPVSSPVASPPLGSAPAMTSSPAPLPASSPVISPAAPSPAVSVELPPATTTAVSQSVLDSPTNVDHAVQNLKSPTSVQNLKSPTAVQNLKSPTAVQNLKSPTYADSVRASLGLLPNRNPNPMHVTNGEDSSGRHAFPASRATHAPSHATDVVASSHPPPSPMTSVAASDRPHTAANQAGSRTLSWADCVSGKSHPLQIRGDQFRLDSGEVCVKIPNSVITRNKKSWASFVLGQFHGTLPSMGALHAILNGIWSSKAKDITISRVGTQSVLIKVPNPATRKRILEQGIWHIEGQSMFVGAWEPGLKAEIPEMKEAPVWVDFKNVPPHFFSAEGLEYIASMVGRPLHLHPRTAAMTHLEVARVFTLVDLKKPLPEAVNVMFESGELHRIEVSCQWLPPLCEHCHQYGHSLRRCPTAPVTCTVCKSTTHSAEECRRSKQERPRNRRRSPSPHKRSTTLATGSLPQAESVPSSEPTQVAVEEPSDHSSPPMQQAAASTPQVEHIRQAEDVGILVSQTMEDSEIETLDQLMGTPSVLPLHKGKKKRGKGAVKETRLDNHGSDRESSDYEADETAEESLVATVFKRSMRPGKSSKRRGLLGSSAV